MRPQTVRLGDLRVEGVSRAGIETWLRVHPPGVAFDVGRGALHLAGARDLFVSHGHLDHALGVPFLLSQRSLHHLAGTRVFCPREVAPDLGAYIEAAARLERADYAYELRGLVPRDRVEVGRNLVVEAFPTDHVVPSLGYHLFRQRRRLRPDLAGEERGALLARREGGEEITEVVEELTVAYCGDTGPGVFTADPRIFTARMLVIECTFVGEEQRGKGALYKHLHLEDLAAHAERFANEALVLVHLSRRHRRGELLAEVGRLLPSLAGRVHVLMGEEA